MKEISLLEVTDKVADLLVSINQRLPARVERLLSRARNQETVVLARHYLEVILKNLKVSRRLHLPLCQDTGMVTVLAECGQEIRFRADPAGSLTGAINEGVAIATRQGYLRSSVVEPLSHINTGNNTPAVVHFSLVPGDRLKLTVMAKGFGSENASSLAMLTPASGWPGIEDFVLETVRKTGPNACPPLFLGIGIGGTSEQACFLAKVALTEIAIGRQPDHGLRKLEQQLKERINQSGIGAGGFGGPHTALDVRIKTYPTHIAGLPVAVAVSCWAHRVGQIEL